MSCCGGSGVVGLCGACGCNPCSCNYMVINETNPVSGVTNVSCVNLSGICVVDAFNAGTLFFRGIDSGDASILSVALNATNHTIVLTVDVNAVAAALPQATTTQRGVGETATDAEAQAKASTTVFLTPSNLAALGASTTFAGFLEIATNAEAIAGTSPTLAITPASLAATIAANYGTTTTFADAVARAAAVPTFAGQFGYQVDIANPMIGFAIAPGSWLPVLSGQNTNYLAPATGTVFSMGANAFVNFTGNGTSSLTVSGGAQLNLDGSPFAISGVVTNDVLVGNDGLGSATAYPLINFMSTAQVQTGYTAFTNPSTIRTCNTGTVTLQQLAQLVGTLINDLKLVLLPAT